ncbi:carbohydrate-binding family 9-like protein [Mucilaginibacter litoreus]|uniref:Carbohydrate-binding family 9-like protein n=1 Tax=Mucilaginibacter litoreus TaxID=1048221 RepID=A0ABW3AV18_9SPHI
MEADSIPYLHSRSLLTAEDAAAILDNCERSELAFAPWHTTGNRPYASFSIAYSNDAIYLKYYVTEDALRAQYSKFNDPVFEDSCVEFFIAFNDDAQYYNLEFNCMGTSRVQYGAHKTGRIFIPAALLKNIKHQTLIKSKVPGNVQWELTLCIPKQVFMYHPALSFAHSRARVNFYKCGDGLPVPHFLCWNNIKADVPEFHLSQFFRDVTFGKQLINNDKN